MSPSATVLSHLPASRESFTDTSPPAIPCPSSGLSDEKACCVLERMAEANLDKVHSINGFINGIVRRVQEAGTQEGPGDLTKLPRKVRHRLEDLIAEVRWSYDTVYAHSYVSYHAQCTVNLEDCLSVGDHSY